LSDDTLLNRGELGPYKIERKLGQGAMGGVYLARHRVLDVYHAVKVIQPRLVNDPVLIERFLREARNTAKLKHPNIVQVMGADQVDGTYYLAMEFVQGRTLEDVAREGVNQHDAVRYVHMVANALNLAHRSNIIHRDIKPANVMVNEEDVAKLMDFGLVRDTGTPEGAEDGSQLTMAGFVMGTPSYMPIEQWQGEGVDHRSDIYALGVTLFVLLTGKMPFPGKTARDIFRAVLTGKPANVCTTNPQVDAELGEIVHKAMAAEKEDRFQSAEEFALALESWWDRHPYQGTSLFKAPSLDEAGGATSRGSLGGRATVRSSSATRASLSHSTSHSTGQTMQDSTPTEMGAAQGSKAGLIAAVALILVIGLSVGGWLLFGRDNSGGNSAPPAATFKVDIADPATEATPLPVRMAEFSIPGSSSGAVTLDGKPYQWGSAITLKPGLNKLQLESEGGARTLFVFFDGDEPDISLPALTRADNIIPTRETSYKLAGTVRDPSGLAGLRVELRIDGELRELTVDGQGNFEQVLAVADADISLELQASDRAGNRSKALTFWVVPDRQTLQFLGDEQTPWYTQRNILFTGRLNKSRGVNLRIGGEPAAGDHDLLAEAEDWYGEKAQRVYQFVVDLAPPMLTLTPLSALRVEALPATLSISGKLDDPRATVTVNGNKVSIAADGAFEAKIQVDAFGEAAVTVIATDPAGRKSEQTLNVSVLPLTYKLLGTNTQGAREYLRLTDGMVMVEVKGGKFTRGNKALPDALPVEVELTTFLIGKYEVSNAQYAKFLNAAGINADEAVSRRWLVRNEDGAFWGLEVAGKVWSASDGLENRPVVGVTWNGAREYCKWADADSGELPSEAQWEYAARGTDGRQYPWGAGDVETRLANTKLTGRDESAEVTKLPDGDSAFGLRMMAGNVEEWCLDWYDEGGYARADQRGKDPALTTKPSGAERRAVRGGSFQSRVLRDPKRLEDDDPSELRSFGRARRLPNTGTDDRGFRPAARLPKD
jgi:serine/threonine protein kinase/formylglycine-generating enzyme required for sulfatase activity